MPVATFGWSTTSFPVEDALVSDDSSNGEEWFVWEAIVGVRLMSGKGEWK